MIPVGISVWVFDLDNTLYPASELYDEIGDRMSAYIMRTLGVGDAEAYDLRERYFHEYGATITGLARHHPIDATDFLRDVHLADHSVLNKDAALRALIARLPGRRIIHTNGGGGHAERVLESLNLADLFDGVFDIGAADLVPKPQREAYERLAAMHGFSPHNAMLIEDTLRNLEPAHDMGFATALVGEVHPDPRPPYVQHWARDVKALLQGWLEQPS
ncbi:MAG: pyrimidine 5'-nucleotidase [Hyphomonadaceae bacterium]|nr:pyrimidine 5'-nucleotidase [Hyphomonadaceae bacterium]